MNIFPLIFNKIKYFYGRQHSKNSKNFLVQRGRSLYKFLNKNIYYPVIILKIFKNILILQLNHLKKMDILILIRVTTFIKIQ